MKIKTKPCTAPTKNSGGNLKKTVKCVHYSICLNSHEPLCNDNKCSIIQHNVKAEDVARIGRVEQAIKEYKKEHGIESFIKLDVRGKICKI